MQRVKSKLVGKKPTCKPERKRRPTLNITPQDYTPQSSRITTGRSLLPYQDGRSLWARIMRDTLNALIAHCGGGDISTPRLASCRRIAALEAELVSIEDQIAAIRRKGKVPPLSLQAMYANLADKQRRLSSDIGWDRNSKDVTPELTLEQHLANRDATARFKNGKVRLHKAPIVLEHEDL